MNIRKILLVQKPDEFPDGYVDYLLGGLVYLAGPYSHQSTAVMEYRFNVYVAAAGDMMLDNIEVYAPVVHNHPIACARDMSRGWDFWKQFDLPMLARSRSMIVLQLDGWEGSAGLKAEIEFARVNKIPVFYIKT
jgi:hypothetical protein